MSHWNYRVMKHEYPETEEVGYQIHEVYYDDSGNVSGWTQDEISPHSDDVEGLRWTLERMKEALEKPVLDFKTGKELVN